MNMYIRSRLRQLHLILQQFSAELWPLIYVKMRFFFQNVFEMSSEWKEFYESFVYALVKIEILEIIFFIYLHHLRPVICLHRLTYYCLQLYCMNFWWRGIMLTCSAFMFLR